ncbi:leucine-rich repeat domain-containing protein [Galbitalea sp. SE-J8]|uniref:leucine-rich repeat domain-containing protein n=1 Tax=Galbitalea sp. SE-J8 TaxID=3054952 RepID=UPI00259CAD2A|nr:leucine-rich repeat domain-containing protein [Galbitalea sp. SE-J8]MDM4764134.1 leucine-rich repeat domain-containing protein [Galbitalea sp. SE-J8]
MSVRCGGPTPTRAGNASTRSIRRVVAGVTGAMLIAATLVMGSPMPAQAAAYWSDGTGIEYELHVATHTATVVGYYSTVTTLAIPSTITATPADASLHGDYTVTSIGPNAFYDNSNCRGYAYYCLTSVTIPDTVTSIGSTAFWHNRLASVSLATGLVSIGPSAFQDNQLTSLTLPSSVRTIGASAFQTNHLGSVDLPIGLQTIGDWAFQQNKLTAAAIPGSVTSVGAGAFADNQLTSVTIPDSVTALAPKVFAANYLSDVTIPQTVTTIGDEAFALNQLTGVTVPDSVTAIGAAAFNKNSLVSAHIGRSVTSIGADAFAYNDTLASVTNADGVTSSQYVYLVAGGGATIHQYFGDDPAVAIPGTLGGVPVVTIGDDAFAYLSVASVTIPDSVTAIGVGAFGYGEALTSVNIGRSVTSVGDHAFDDQRISAAVIPDSVVSIGASAFADGSLTAVALGSSLTTIGDDAFWGNHLTALAIPDSVESIGRGAFGFNQLASMSIGRSLTDVGTAAFGNNPLTSVSYPDGSVSHDYLYLVKGGTATILRPLGTPGPTVPGSLGGAPVTAVAPYAYFTTSNVACPGPQTSVSLTLPDSVVTIGEGAFQYSCLTDLRLGAELTTIGDGAFSHNALPTVTLPASVTSIGYAAFNGNPLTSATNPDGLVSHEYVYAGAGGGVTVYQFFGSSTNVAIPEAFGGVPVTAIGGGAFSGQPISGLVVPDSVVAIGRAAFEFDTQLTEATIGSGVTTIDDSAFYGTVKLATVHFRGDAPTTFGTGVFDGGSSSLVLHYLSTARCWTTPYWNGYSTSRDPADGPDGSCGTPEGGSGDNPGDDPGSGSGPGGTGTDPGTGAGPDSGVHDTGTGTGSDTDTGSGDAADTTGAPAPADAGGETDEGAAGTSSGTGSGTGAGSGAGAASRRAVLKRFPAGWKPKSFGKRSGTTKAGKTLKVTKPKFPAAGRAAHLGVTYRWRIGSKVVGTKASLKLKKAWKGTRPTVTVTVGKAGYATLSKTLAFGRIR